MLARAAMPCGGATKFVLRLFDAETPSHFFVQKSFARTIRLHPLTINNKLWNSPLARVFDHLLGSSRSVLDIDFRESEVVLLQKTFSLAAIGTPEGGIDDDFHGAM